MVWYNMCIKSTKQGRQMIKRIQIKNFKCYGEPGVDVVLKRVNFIFGDNSAGKSTFLQLLKMYFMDMGIVNGKSRLPIDLNFDQYVFKGEAERTVKMRVSMFDPCEHDERRDEACPVYDFVSAKGHSTSRYIGWIAYSDIEQGLFDKIHPANKGPSPHPDSKEYLSDPGWYLDGMDGWLPFEVIHNEAARPIRIDSHSHQSSLDENVMLSSDAIDYVNSFFKRLNLPYACKNMQALQDLDFGVTVPVRGVGAGIDGLFATAVSLYNWKSSPFFDLLELEEPESHLNERQISPLMDFLFDAANENSKGQMIVECHSELMALKLKNFVKSGKINTADLAIYFAEKTPDGTVMHEIKIDDKGNFRTKWPNGGFYTERTKIVDEFFKAKASK